MQQQFVPHEIKQAFFCTVQKVVLSIVQRLGHGGWLTVVPRHPISEYPRNLLKTGRDKTTNVSQIYLLT